MPPSALPALRLRLAATFILCLAATGCALVAQPITITPANTTGIYRLGEAASWNIALKAGTSATGLTYTVKSGGLTVVDSGSLALSKGQAVISETATKPDWLLLEIAGKDGTGASFTAGGGALFSPEKITVSAPPPADFDAFWQARLDELAQVPMNPVLTSKPSGVAGVDYDLIQMDNIRGTHIEGQLARPTTGTKFPALLIVQWAGVYSLDPSTVTWRAQQGWLALNIQAHDIHAVDTASYYTAEANGPLANYWAQGNEDPNTSYFLRMYLACYRAVDYLASRPDWNGKVLVVTGASQGGLQTLLSASINPKVTAAVADVPAGCDQTGPDVGRSPGWPQWYYQTYLGQDPAKVKAASRYYDICNFVSKIRCPVLIGTGLDDTTVPCIGVYAAFNQIRSPREIVAMPLATHTDNQQAWNARSEAVLALLRSGSPPGLSTAADGSLRWTAPLPSSSTAGTPCSSPVEATDGTLVAALLGASPGTVECYERDGSMHWTYTAPAAVSGAPACTPDGYVVFGCTNGALIELDATGEVRWQASAGAAVSGSPALAPDGTILIATTDGRIESFSAGGTARWNARFAGGSLTSPIVGPDGTVYAGSASGMLHAIAPGGAERWSFNAGSAIARPPSLAADGALYFGTGDGHVVCLARDGTQSWSFDAGGAVEATPVIGPDGTIYVGAGDGRLHALAVDGTQKWEFPAAATTAFQPITASAAVRRDGSVVFGTQDGLVVCVDPSGVQRWATMLGAGAYGSPLLADDGTLFVGSAAGSLCALTGTETPLLADWMQVRRDPHHQAWQPMGRFPSGGGRLSALSVRAQPGTDAGALVAGFIVAGSGSRTVLLRAVGPTLAGMNVDGAMPDPFLTLYQGTMPIATNDDWGSQPNAADVATTAARLGDFSLPQDSKDAALLTNLGPGLYTAYPLGTGRQTGVTLVELYDAGGTGTSTFTGLSARDQVGTGSQILVAGFIISGGSRSVVIQGIGPTLAKYINPVLADPVLRLYRGTQLIAENDDWGVSSDPSLLSSASRAAGAQALNPGSHDAALVATLPPGLYSAELLGANGLTGPGMIEVYALP